MTTLTGRHAIVTGGGSGIGLAIARRLRADGADVTIMGRGLARLAAAAREIGAVAVSCDITDARSVESAFAEARARRPCDILVNNAGAALSKSFAKTSLEDWRSMLDLNLTGAFLCAKAALPDLADRDYGRIINIASTAGQRGYPYVCAYVAAKHGLVGMTKALALELAASKTTVNAVCPGFTETDLVEQSIERIAKNTGRSRGEARQELVKFNPQGRLIQPEEVAAAVAWLCSADAGGVTGQSISVAGGEVM